MTVRNKKGFTLVELSTALAAGTILLLAFSSMLVFTSKESSAASRRAELLQDVLVLDGLVHKQLSKTIGDSLLIYADTTAEQNQTASNSGSILHAKDGDGNAYRVATSNQRLTWRINGVSQQVGDSEVTNLNFQRSSSSYGEKVDLAITFLMGEDTLNYEWIIAFRN